MSHLSPLLKQATSVRHSSASRYANRLRVLVVDDNPTNREILQDQLANAGIRVAAAHSGACASETARPIAMICVAAKISVNAESPKRNGPMSSPSM